MGYILNAISPTYFILDTKVQPKGTFIDPSALGQGQIFPKMCKKTKQLAISWMLFHPQTLSHLLSLLFVTHLDVTLLLPMLLG